MKVSQVKTFALDSSHRVVIFGPHGEPLPAVELTAPEHEVTLKDAVAQLAREKITPGKVALASGTLAMLPSTLSADQAAHYLVTQSVAPQQAPGLAKAGLELLNNPLVRCVLVFVAGAGVAFVVVERTTWSRTRKWVVSLAFGAFTLALWLVARHFHWLR